MRALVVHASRHGSTQEIAEHIALTLQRYGYETTTQTARYAESPAGYDFVVIGSAVYFNHWLGAAKKYVSKHEKAIVNLPAWLFSSGPVGKETKDAQGRDLRTVLIPKEIAEFERTIRPRNHRVFFGAFDPSKLKFPFSLLLKLPANREKPLLPEGDFRDWKEIETWAASIAEAMIASKASAA